MTNKLWRFLGIMAFWLSWPALYFRLRRTSRVRVVLLCKGKILLVRNWYNSGQWQLPGGGIRDSETAKQAAKREIAEEVAIDIAESELKPLGQKFLATERGLSFACQVFIAEVPTKLFATKKHEIVDACWRNTAQPPANISYSTKHAISLVEKST